MGVIGLHHVQLAMPAGEEASARSFYVDGLGLTEVAKPPDLAARGGCWFTGPGTEVHLGVEAEFRPARKAHPALLVDDLDAMEARLTNLGAAIVVDQPLAGFRRWYVADPFGNRIEVMQAVAATP